MPTSLPPDEPPPIVAPAHPQAQPVEPSIFSARIGTGVGWGHEGVATAAFASAEVFPIPWVGGGAEASAVESGWFLSITDYDTLVAARGRLTARYPLTRPTSSGLTLAISATFGIGRAAKWRNDYYEQSTLDECAPDDPNCCYSDDPDCDCSSDDCRVVRSPGWFEDTGFTRRRTSEQAGWSPLFETLLTARSRVFAAGLGLRYEAFGPSGWFALVGTAGVEF